MNKRILFLYFTPLQKMELDCCESVFKAFFRKFRTSVSFSYLKIDISPTCREAMKSTLLFHMKSADTVFLCNESDLSGAEAEFFREAAGLFATAHYNSGKQIFFPVETRRDSFQEDGVEETVFYQKDDVKRSAQLCTSFAAEHKQSICVCTDKDSIGEFLFKEFENSLACAKHLDVHHSHPREVIWHASRYIPGPDVVFTVKSVADVILLHMHTSQNFPDGYTVHYSDYGKIYATSPFPFSQDENRRIFLILIAFAASAENEFKMKNAAFWLRRSVSAAFSEFGCDSKENFINKIILQLNEPMRKRTPAENNKNDKEY